MAGDHGRHKRSDNEAATKAALSRLLDSSAFLITALLVLGMLNYGWVIYPKLGIVWGLLNGTIIIGIIIVGMAVIFIRGKSIKHHECAACYSDKSLNSRESDVAQKHLGQHREKRASPPNQAASIHPKSYFDLTEQ